MSRPIIFGMHTRPGGQPQEESLRILSAVRFLALTRGWETGSRWGIPEKPCACVLHTQVRAACPPGGPQWRWGQHDLPGPTHTQNPCSGGEPTSWCCLHRPLVRSPGSSHAVFQQLNILVLEQLRHQPVFVKNTSWGEVSGGVSGA